MPLPAASPAPSFCFGGPKQSQPLLLFESTLGLGLPLCAHPRALSLPSVRMQLALKDADKLLKEGGSTWPKAYHRRACALVLVRTPALPGCVGGALTSGFPHCCSHS